MKYCGNCGAKLDKDSNFCGKCGKPTSAGIEKIKESKKRKKDENNQKLILKTGIALIIIASVIFTLFSFKNISDLFKVIFLGVESILFIYISILLKNKTNYEYKPLYFIGVLLIPIIFIFLLNNSLLGNMNFISGAGLYIYLAISFLVCTLVYILSYKFTNMKTYLYLSYIFMDLFIAYLSVFIFNNFSLDMLLSKKSIMEFALSITSIIIFNLLFLLSTCFKNNNISSTFKNYLRILLFVLLIPIIFLFIYEEYDLTIFNIINSVVYLASSYTIVLKSKENPFNFVIPIFVTIVSLLCVNYILSDYNNISIFISLSVILLEFFISYLIENKYFKLSTYIVSILSLFIILVSALNYSYILSFICFIIVLISSIFTYKIENNNSYKSVISSVIMICIYFCVHTLVKSITLTKNEYICLIASVIYSSIYVIFKSKNIKLYKDYEFLSYFFILISSLLVNNNSITFNILNEIVWIYYFTLKISFDDKRGVRNFLLTGCILNLYIILHRFDVGFYYILLSFSILSMFISILSNKVQKLNRNVFDIISIIFVSLASLYNFKNFSTLILGINILLYCTLYYKNIRHKDILFIFRFMYTLIGFLMIHKIFNYFIDVQVISSLLSMITFIVIIIIMYLMRVEDDKKIICYSPVILYPYFILISNIDILHSYNIEFILTPIIIYIFLFSEKVIRFKDSSLKNIFQILLLSIIYTILLVNLHNDTILYIYSLLLSVIYVIYGITKSNSSFVTFGCVTLIITTILLFFEVSSSLVLVFSTLFVGASLVTYITLKSTKREIK